MEVQQCSIGKWEAFSLSGLRFTMDMLGFGELERRMRRAGPGVRHVLAVQMAKDTEPYVPAQTKSLANRTQVTDDIIIYPGPYARFLYYGKLMIDPNTGSAWAPEGATKVVTGQNLNISTAVHGKAQSHWFEASKAQNREKWVRVAGRAMRREFGG